MSDHETRLKRLRIRSWRRGTKEMDLILGPFFDDRGGGLDAETLERYESLLAENDQDLYQWFSEQAPTPDRHKGILGIIRDHHSEKAQKS